MKVPGTGKRVLKGHDFSRGVSSPKTYVGFSAHPRIVAPSPDRLSGQLPSHQREWVQVWRPARQPFWRAALHNSQFTDKLLAPEKCFSGVSNRITPFFAASLVPSLRTSDLELLLNNFLVVLFPRDKKKPLAARGFSLSRRTEGTYAWAWWRCATGSSFLAR
jgi:hypothetical protein